MEKRTGEEIVQELQDLQDKPEIKVPLTNKAEREKSPRKKRMIMPRNRMSTRGSIICGGPNKTGAGPKVWGWFFI